MEKTLTISVACYNVGQFLRKTLDSLIAPEIMDELEVLVVNDGSSDDTAEIAREYEEKYPQTFLRFYPELFHACSQRPLFQAAGRR